jgi:hypothetical protein
MAIKRLRIDYTVYPPAFTPGQSVGISVRSRKPSARRDVSVQERVSIVISTRQTSRARRLATGGETSISGAGLARSFKNEGRQVSKSVQNSCPRKGHFPIRRLIGLYLLHASDSVVYYRQNRHGKEALGFNNRLCRPCSRGECREYIAGRVTVHPFFVRSIARESIECSSALDSSTSDVRNGYRRCWSECVGHGDRNRFASPARVGQNLADRIKRNPAGDLPSRFPLHDLSC